jgi:hypothetical protein
MKRTILVLLILGLLVPFSRAQLWKMKRWEAVGGLGTTHYFGDIGGFSKTKNILGFKDLSFSQTRFDLNFNLKYRISQNVNVRVSLTYGFFHATDKRGSNEARGFEAFTSFFEPALLGEYYFIKNKAESSYLFTKGRGAGFSGLFKSLDFYVFTGIGGLSYSVRGNNELTNYGINGGGFTAVLPVGIGTTLVYSPDFNFGIEIGGRYSFSDNLDGYTSKYSSSNDVYYLLNFTITYKLKTGPKGLPSFR